MAVGDDRALTERTALALARMVRERDVSCAEIVEAHLRRMEAENPRLHAIVQLDADGARAAAAATDAAIARGDDLPPLAGVPFTVKDWIEVEGLVCAAGFEERREYVPKHTATVVQRMRDAGAILLGKTKCGSGADVYPRPNNPHDPARTPGGSSSGDAVAVAAGMTAIGIGSDSGGSLRLPAAWCGVATIKPTNGRVPSTGHFPRIIALTDPRTTIGPMARSAADLFAALRAIAGPDGRDASVVPVPLGDPARVDLRGMRAATYAWMDGVETTPGTVDAVRVACDALRDAGVEVVEQRPPRIDEARRITEDYWARHESMSLSEWRPPREHRLKTPEDVERHLFEWDRFRRMFTGFMDVYDLIVCPATPWPAPPHGAEAIDDYQYTLPYSLTGQPVAVVRCGTSPEGLPLGVQLAARAWRDDVALAAAIAIEERLGGDYPRPAARA
jgi:amidase